MQIRILYGSKSIGVFLLYDLGDEHFGRFLDLSTSTSSLNEVLNQPVAILYLMSYLAKSECEYVDNAVILAQIL